MRDRSAMEALELQRLLEWQLKTDDFNEFVKFCMPGYLSNWHVDLICKRLSKLKYQQGQRLIIQLPPQTGKSNLISRHLPAWLLGNNPRTKIILASYASDLAQSFNRDNQRLMDSTEYQHCFPHTQLNTRNVKNVAGGWKRTNDIFEVVGYGGYLKTVGVGDSTTGFGADCLIIDDPCKGRVEADSPTIQKRNISWYRSVATTRLSLGANVIIMHTPWNLRDISFQVMELAKVNPHASQWELIRIPAVAEGDLHPQDPRALGEPIWPSFYGDESVMQRKRIDVGEREWNSLYQCNPTPEGGNIIKRDWLQFYNALPEQFDELIQSWDLRFKKGQDSGDFVVGQVWGRIGVHKYLVDQVRGRWSFMETLAEFIRLSEKWPQAFLKLVENKANGPALQDALDHKVGGIVLIEPPGSKTQRLYACQPAFEAGNVFIPEVTEWSEQYIAELCDFPAAPHDDCVDTTSQAILRLMETEGVNFEVEAF